MILLDTHALIWWAGDPAKLSARATRAIRRASAGADLAVSAISLFETATLLRRGRLLIGTSPERWLKALCAIPGLRIEPVSTEIAWTAGSLPPEFPGDPADRIIVATAHALDVRLVTADDRLRAALPSATLW